MTSTESTSPESTRPPTAAGFAALGIAPELLTALATLGYEEPTPIQRESIPLLLAGRDLLGMAGTGTGKTAAFALPLLQRLPTTKLQPGKPHALVLVPTRELAMQVAEAVHRYGKARNTSVLPIYGGQSTSMQLRALGRGTEIIVATPGRALDHLERGAIELDQVRTVILDEADEMLDMGFAEDLEAILQRTPKERQTALFSATLPPRILAIAERHLRDPVRIAIARERTQSGAVPRVRQLAYMVPRSHKHAALGRVLDMETPTSAIIFCRTRLEVDELTEAMNARGYRAEALHGGFQQEHRDRVMRRFRANQADLLIATDVAARGLDIDHVSHVVNYDVPTDPDTYVHRIGRTGRAGREGVAITFAEPREHRLLKIIQQATQQKIAVAALPTVADLRNKRLALTRASLREAVLAGGLESFRSVIEDLSSEHDLMDVAAAAVKLAHEATHAEDGVKADEQDLPVVQEPQEQRSFPARGPVWGKPGNGPKREFAPRAPRAPRGDAPPMQNSNSAKLFVGVGRLDGMRPADLVGAIANEAGISGAAIGSIQIADRFALVEVPEQDAETIIRALRGTKIRGRRVTVRRDREAGN